jgi:drug/metabolite transporter (DMT)-like permease
MSESSSKTHIVRAHLALLGAAVIYGANYLIAKLVMPNPIDPNSFILLRIWGACALFWICFGRKITQWPDRSDWGRLLLCALTGVITNQLLFFNGLSLTSPIHASIMMTSNPMIVLILSALLLKKPIRIHQLLGILIGAAGACMIILARSAPGQSGYWLGDVFVLINSISWATYLVIVVPLMQKYNNMAVTTWVFTLGALIITPVFFFNGDAVDWGALSALHWWSIGYVIIGTTFLTYAFNMIGVKYLAPTTVSAYIYLQPLLAGIFAWMTASWFTHDYSGDLTWYKVMSACIVVAGVYLSSLSKWPWQRSIK